MSHFGDFMDDVPVKISEKYKRPPSIDLPYSLNEYPNHAQNLVDNIKYCSIFETNVLAKIKELRSAKETKRSERRYRLQLLEEAKQKKLDAIATAEAEEKLKQLSVSEVSYPSTEEISAFSPDDKIEKEEDSTHIQEVSPEPVVEVSANNDLFPVSTNLHPSDPNILLPIQMISHQQHNNLLDDPDPLQDLKLNMRRPKLPQYSHNIESLTYKDFENDTSSPFDNVELKTINDMELLAQVLQNQKDVSTSYHNHPHYLPEPYVIPNCTSQAQVESGFIPNTFVEQQVQGPGLMYSPPQHYPLCNGYYMPPENTCDNAMPLENMYMPNYQYYVPVSYPQVDPNYYNTQMPQNMNISNDASYIPQPYYYQSPQVPLQYSSDIAYSPQISQKNEPTQIKSLQNTVKSRSRSVPDIVKELDQEIAAAKNRVNERSYNASPAPKCVPSSSRKKSESVKNHNKIDQLPNPFKQLSPKLQETCQKINGMGFPIERVARLCVLVGDNDKKLIEALLIMGELMDLGFSESKVSAALEKNEFNKDKALDELVS